MSNVRAGGSAAALSLPRPVADHATDRRVRLAARRRQGTGHSCEGRNPEVARSRERVRAHSGHSCAGTRSVQRTCSACHAPASGARHSISLSACVWFRRARRQIAAEQRAVQRPGRAERRDRDDRGQATELNCQDAHHIHGVAHDERIWHLLAEAQPHVRRQQIAQDTSNWRARFSWSSGKRRR